MKTIEEFIKELNEKFPPNDFREGYSHTTGKRFWKIVWTRNKGKNKTAYAFVDKSNGDLYKAATWAAPANYVRGNINDESGLDACEEYGVKYLIG